MALAFPVWVLVRLGILVSDDAVAVWQKFRNPRTNERLGKPPVSERRQSTDANDNQLAETTQQTKRDVAGLDLTFTIPKDASILWALGSTGATFRHRSRSVTKGRSTRLWTIWRTTCCSREPVMAALQRWP